MIFHAIEPIFYAISQGQLWCKHLFTLIFVLLVFWHWSLAFYSCGQSLFRPALSCCSFWSPFKSLFSQENLVFLCFRRLLSHLYQPGCVATCEFPWTRPQRKSTESLSVPLHCSLHVVLNHRIWCLRIHLRSTISLLWSPFLARAFPRLNSWHANTISRTVSPKLCPLKTARVAGCVSPFVFRFFVVATIPWKPQAVFCDIVCSQRHSVFCQLHSIQ